MSGRYLLDTNIIIALFADEVVVKHHLAQASEVYIPAVVIGELCYGAYKSKRIRVNLKRIDELVEHSVVLGCETETARHYGEIKNVLRQKGHPLPENDIWIAALATQHMLTVVTRDAHLQAIEMLQAIAW